jgi:Predicted integral membrane protein
MRENSERNGVVLLGGIGLGALLMYFLDPSKGRRRRALARDRTVRALSRAGERVGGRAHDLGNRAAGIAARVGSRSGEDQPSDDLIVKRVRAVVGHVVSHPRSVIVASHEGNVELSGPIIAREVEGLLSRVRKVRGVQSVHSRLDAHDWAADVPGLQGAVERRSGGGVGGLLERDWPHGMRLAGSAALGAMAVYGTRRSWPVGTALGLTGAALLARGSRSAGIAGDVRDVRSRGGRGAVRLRKTVLIDAPVEQVFDFFCEFENYPAFMTHVRDVREIGDDRTHWVVDGPDGVTVEWDADTTKVVPNEEIAWRSVRGSAIRQAGVLRFEPAPADATRVTLRLSYGPRSDARAAVVTSLFGSDPAEEMTDALMRVKTSIESGRR